MKTHKVKTKTVVILNDKLTMTRIRIKKTRIESKKTLKYDMYITVVSGLYLYCEKFFLEILLKFPLKTIWPFWQTLAFNIFVTFS